MSNFLTNSRLTKRTVFLLLFVFLSLPVGGAASHYCFDGLEPPVTVHFDNFKGHVEHEDEIGHNDIEKEPLSDSLLNKVFDHDLLAIPAAAVLVAFLPRTTDENYLPLAVQKSNARKSLLPPSRAPPSFS